MGPLYDETRDYACNVLNVCPEPREHITEQLEIDSGAREEYHAFLESLDYNRELTLSDDVGCGDEFDDWELGYDAALWADTFGSPDAEELPW